MSIFKQCCMCILLFFLISCCANEKGAIRNISMSEPPSNALNESTNDHRTGSGEGGDENDNTTAKSYEGDPFELPVISKLKGSNLKAISIALLAFSSEDMISQNKKNVQNYDVELRQNNEYFFVYFGAHLGEDEQSSPPEGGETSLGKSTMFVIEKTNFVVRRRYFLR